MEAVADLELDDFSRLEDEKFDAAGMSIVQQILGEMTSQGRRRRAAVEAGTINASRYRIYGEILRELTQTRW